MMGNDGQNDGQNESLVWVHLSFDIIIVVGIIYCLSRCFNKTKSNDITDKISHENKSNISSSDLASSDQASSNEDDEII